MRLRGILLFLFIPAVLVLYLRMPFGLAPSVPVGIALMIGHRFLARPFLDRHVGARCFWCGGALDPGAGVATPFTSRGKTVPARGCDERCGGRTRAFARAVAALRPVLAILILGPVFVYLANALLWIAGIEAIPLDAARWGFKIPIAAAVVGLSFAYPIGARLDREPAIDFPVHNLFLLGIGNTMWVFRLVGMWWLLDGAWRLARLAAA